MKTNLKKTKVIFIPKRVRRCSTSIFINKIKEKRDYTKIKDTIKRKLYYLSDHNPSHLGKISALLTYKGKIVAESSNIDEKELHAEVIAMNEAKKKKIPLEKTKIYILIPPCIMCAKVILENNIKEVFYINPYGNDDGTSLLRKNNVKVKRYK